MKCLCERPNPYVMSLRDDRGDIYVACGLAVLGGCPAVGCDWHPRRKQAENNCRTCVRQDCDRGKRTVEKIIACLGD